jgi:flagellar hook-basal body complex protein FliE
MTMDVRLKPFDFAAAVARAGLRTSGASKAGFGSALSDALKGVSNMQDQATYMQNELQMDNPTVSLEQTMVTMQKAQIGFQAAISVRNRLVQSYTDIMNMQV